MPFEPEKITRDHVLKAVEMIEQQAIALSPSTRYNVVVNGKEYPPKEIMRYAHLLMNGEKLWELSGGGPTNRFLRDFGFDIISRGQIETSNEAETNMALQVWKLGCYWGKGAPSFYDFMKDRQMVIGVQKYEYRVGDLVMVTDGFQVKAISKVLESPIGVITNQNFKEHFQKMEIDYTENVNFAKVEWYELPPDKRFEFQLQAGIRQVQNQDVINRIVDLWNQRHAPTNVPLKAPNPSGKSKNMILYGPPGTGKTYNSIDMAVNIATGTSRSHRENKFVFDDLRKVGQIEFVTFHQNYTYEDFIGGLRPDAESGNLRFSQYKGIFYQICKKARDNYESSKSQTSLDPYENLVQEMLLNITDEKPLEFKTVRGKPFWLTDYSDKTIYLKKSTGSELHSLSILTLIEMSEGKRELVSGLNVYYIPVIDYLNKQRRPRQSGEPLNNYVLIIDEINRANISKVFGELITLLEEDKRIDGDNELRVTLPSGEKDFAIPPNLYVIGTMNTADKSIALIDIALRRRFEFIGKYPEKNDSISNDAWVLLSKINEAIYQKKNSADYLIGHAYFMNGNPTEVTLRNKVIPLLTEYFSGKVNLVSEIFIGTGWSVRYNSNTYEWNIEQEAE